MLVRNRFPREATAALHRFAWMFLSLYGATSIALWAFSVTGFGFVGPVTAYTVEISLTIALRSEEHTSELQSRLHLVCRLLLEKKKKNRTKYISDCYAL